MAKKAAGGSASLLSDRPGYIGRLYADHADAVNRAVGARLWSLPRAETEDVAAEVWLKLIRDDGARLRSFTGRNGAAFRTWLVRVALNAATDHLRRRRNGSALQDRGQAEGGGVRSLPPFLLCRWDPDPLDRLVAREGRRIIVEAVGRLGPRYRAVVRDWFRHERTPAETAARLGVAVGTVYSMRARAIQELRRDLLRRGLVVRVLGCTLSSPTAVGRRCAGGCRHVPSGRLAAALCGSPRARGVPSYPDAGHIARCRRCWTEFFGLAMLRAALASSLSS